MAEFTVPRRTSQAQLPGYLGQPASQPADYGAQVGEALGQIAVTIKKRQQERQEKLDKLYLAKRKSEIIHIFNEARINAEGRTGEDALGLFNEQSQMWDEEKLNELYGNVPQHLQAPLMEIYLQERSSHLGKITNYQIKEEKRYEQKTRDELAFAVSSKTIDADFGDFNAVQTAILEIKDIKDNDPEAAQADIDNMMVAVVQKWARDNPEGIIKFIEQNESFFEDSMGAKIEDVYGIAEDTKKLLKTEENLRLKKQEDELEKERVKTQNEFIALQTKGELTPDMVLQSNLEPMEGSGSKRAFLDRLDLQANGELAVESDQDALFDIKRRAYNEEITDENEVWGLVEEKKLTLEDAEATIKILRTGDKVLKESLKREIKFIKDSILGTAATFAEATQAQVDAFNKAEQELIATVDSATTIEEKRAMLIHGDSYIVDKIIMKHKLSPAQQLDAMINEVDLRPQQDVVPRKEGESPEEYLRRIQ